MGASRESYNLLLDLKYKNYKRFWQNISILLLIKRDKYAKKLIIKDSFTTPFNKKIGCKWFGHDWKFDHEDNYYICWKCFKHETKQVHQINQRDEKIDKILK